MTTPTSLGGGGGGRLSGGPQAILVVGCHSECVGGEAGQPADGGRVCARRTECHQDGHGQRWGRGWRDADAEANVVCGTGKGILEEKN